MVTNFEQYTHELTEIEEKVILPWIIEAWSRKNYGEVLTQRQQIQGINAMAIREKLYKPSSRNKPLKSFYILTGPRFRKIIHHIRVKNLISKGFLLASSKGYYLSTDQREIDKFVKSCYERASSFKEVGDALTMHKHK